MATTSDPPSNDTVTVIGPQFCFPRSMELVLTGKALQPRDADVTNVNGGLVLKVRGEYPAFGDRRVLLDATENTLISFQIKAFTFHRRWKVFRGDSRNPKDLLFTAKRSSRFQYKTTLDVFLASNTDGGVCDFKIKSSLSGDSCTIYQGDSSVIVAKMREVTTFMDRVKHRSIYGITVYPNVDYAFIVALVVILNDF